MKSIRTLLTRRKPVPAIVGIPQASALVLRAISELLRAGRAEEAEEQARTFQQAAGRAPGRDDLTNTTASMLAARAVLAQGRAAEAVSELDGLLAALTDPPSMPHHAVSLAVRVNRAAALCHLERTGEAETECRDVLKSMARMTRPSAKVELAALHCLVLALNGQGRYEEAEAVARGALPRAEREAAMALGCGLVRSLNGQGRHEEALTEARKTAPAYGRGGASAIGLGVATALHGLGHRAEAEAEARQVLADCEKYLPPGHRRTQQTHQLLARITTDSPG
ncbi:tetratricopeptide repeat protein [Streptomyces sp. NBC_01431]|uniref:tetratricopeptide repeat protein n=1 Tax=Streptomyces sp. NBC_01431 TaxID=2903863 RepID=UPI002E353ACE|nr:tetratricopeptide repeat protein [Streptomyces sp. NBC_01431]